jgi:hypothetical protein
MNEHLTFDEILQAVNKSPQSLAAQRFKHFESCEKCLQAYNSQRTADKILKTTRPQRAPLSITQRVMDTLSATKIKEKTDWTFLFAMVLLFSIASWFLFSGKVGSLINTYAPKIITEEVKSIEPGMMDTIRDSVSSFEINFDLPDLSFGNIYLLFGALAIMFYMLLDKKIGHNFKVRKT